MDLSVTFPWDHLGNEVWLVGRSKKRDLEMDANAGFDVHCGEAIEVSENSSLIAEALR